MFNRSYWNCLEFCLFRRKVMLDLTWTVIWIGWIVSPALRRPEFDHCSVYWGCVVDKLLLAQTFVV